MGEAEKLAELWGLGAAKTMAELPACGTCRWFVKSPDLNTRLAGGGECHGGPPVPLVLPAKGGIGVQGFWPPVDIKTPGCRHHVTGRVS